MDIGGVGSVYADYMTSQASGNRTTALQSRLESSSVSADEDELKSACKEFESYFVEQVFEAMMKTTKVFSDDDEDGYASKMVDYFKDFAVQELCSEVTAGEGLGLANTLYEQMKRNYGIGVTQPEDVLEE
ncbi:MAG: rod-binding protein [Lachnospiraceae bacterium]|nr:rod-binding protein [Lachnospiraceae bacterium]MBO5144562.1 rod-binding protein [Lachnospiraceae bacterium]